MVSVDPKRTPRVLFWGEVQRDEKRVGKQSGSRLRLPSFRVPFPTEPCCGQGGHQDQAALHGLRRGAGGGAGAVGGGGGLRRRGGGGGPHALDARVLVGAGAAQVPLCRSSDWG